MPTASSRAALVTLPMAITFAALLSTPLWLAQVGLYQYLALEIMIWMLVALGYNLMLGTTGLPSFGHGAFFGIGAYAFGLLQQRVWASLWFDLFGAVLVTAAFAAIVAACISHRRGIYYALLTIAFGQIVWFVSIKWHTVTGGEDGLLNIERLPVSLGVVQFDLQSNEALFYFCFALIALSAWLNLGLRIAFPASYRLDPNWATLLLAYDLLQLAGLLYLTGGLENPFAILVVRQRVTLEPGDGVGRALLRDGRGSDVFRG